MKHTRSRAVAHTAACLAALALGTCAYSVAAQDKQDPAGTGKKTKLRFTVSKETTHVTTPVDKDGYIDYVAALNERLRRGVTPDNNAAVLLWKAMGPHPEKSSMPAEFFRWLGFDEEIDPVGLIRALGGGWEARS